MDLRQQQRNRAPERPAAQPAAPQQPVEHYRSSSDARGSKNGLSKAWKIVIGVVLLLAVVGAIAYSVLGIGSAVDKSKYQAVFLTNGQVYFGKLDGWGGSQATLTDVYYFQASGDTTGADSENPEETDAITQTLVKLGEEIHKPTDKLILNEDAVLFVENIEDDGQVVEAIKQNQSND